jgi:protein-glutamine gamma-glutamyltransferase
MDRLRRFADTMRFKWFKWVIEYDLERQLGFFKRIGNVFRGGASEALGGRWRDLRKWSRGHRGSLMIVLTAALALSTAFYLWRRRRGRHRRSPARSRRDRDPVAALYLAALRTLARRGWPRPPAATPREHARALARDGAPGASALEKLTELYYAAEYGGRSGEAARAQARQLAGAIDHAVREAPRRRKPGPFPRS